MDDVLRMFVVVMATCLLLCGLTLAAAGLRSRRTRVRLTLSPSARSSSLGLLTLGVVFTLAVWGGFTPSAAGSLATLACIVGWTLTQMRPLRTANPESLHSSSMGAEAPTHRRAA